MSRQCSCGLPGRLKFHNIPQYFCYSCFSLKFEKKVRNQIPKYVQGSSIAVALSGGKDSTTLLHVLHKNQRKLKITMLMAIILEEETTELQFAREKVITKLKQNYSDIHFIQKSYSELFDYTLPRLIQQSDNQGLGFTPCAICGILRRHGIMRLALDNKADFIAMGNTLEDEAETILLNIIRGNPRKNYRDKIEYKPVDRKSLPLRIKPLVKISEKTVRIYSKIHQLPILNVQCTFALRSLRSEISIFLNSIEEKNPRVLYNITSSIRKETNRNSQVKMVHKCRRCSSYSPELECAACRVIQKIMN
ncbi:MAG: ATP-binding protein [Candidatus Hodarchaeota archaeon]